MSGIKLTASELKDVKSVKNKSVERLVAFYESVINNPYYESYVSVSLQWRFLMKELEGCPVSINGDKEDKSFDRGIKIFMELKTITDNLEYLKKHLLPDEITDAEIKISHYDKARVHIEKNSNYSE